MFVGCKTHGHFSSVAFLLSCDVLQAYSKYWLTNASALPLMCLELHDNQNSVLEHRSRVQARLLVLFLLSSSS